MHRLVGSAADSAQALALRSDLQVERWRNPVHAIITEGGDLGSSKGTTLSHGVKERWLWEPDHRSVAGSSPVRGGTAHFTERVVAIATPPTYIARLIALEVPWL
ncbi:MAG: hypothetical protein WD942_06090, partial [Dehalococcoidia bacterium]